jgi:hypothetical protein
MGSLRAYFAVAAGLALVAVAAGQPGRSAAGTAAWCAFSESWMGSNTRQSYANALNGQFGSPVCRDQTITPPGSLDVPTGCQVRCAGRLAGEAGCRFGTWRLSHAAGFHPAFSAPRHQRGGWAGR